MKKGNLPSTNHYSITYIEKIGIREVWKGYCAEKDLMEIIKYYGEAVGYTWAEGNTSEDYIFHSLDVRFLERIIRERLRSLGLYE